MKGTLRFKLDLETVQSDTDAKFQIFLEMTRTQRSGVLSLGENVSLLTLGLSVQFQLQPKRKCLSCLNQNPQVEFTSADPTIWQKDGWNRFPNKCNIQLDTKSNNAQILSGRNYKADAALAPHSVRVSNSGLTYNWEFWTILHGWDTGTRYLQFKLDLDSEKALQKHDCRSMFHGLIMKPTELRQLANATLQPIEVVSGHAIWNRK